MIESLQYHSCHGIVNETLHSLLAEIGEGNHRSLHASVGRWSSEWYWATGEWYIRCPRLPVVD